MNEKPMLANHRLSLFLAAVIGGIALILISAPILRMTPTEQDFAVPQDIYAIARLAGLPQTGTPGKKRQFFAMMTPAVAEAQNRILKDRMELTRLEELVTAQTPLTVKEKNWLKEMGVKMRLPLGEEDITEYWISALMMRVDIVPFSLALAQSAEESGWGTSRFAREGNAFYGQWTYDPSGMIPKSQRVEKGDHRIARFKTPTDSVTGYMQNLNSHPAYEDFRLRRAKRRTDGQVLLGTELLKGLSAYSERGGHYIKSINSIIRFNGLHALDWVDLPLDPQEIRSIFNAKVG